MDNRAAVEQIFVGLVQAVSANNALITSLITEIKGLRDDLKAKEGITENLNDLVNNTASLGEDLQELTGSIGMAFRLLQGAAEAGKKGRVTWEEVLDVFTQIELEAQQEEAEPDGDGEQPQGQEIFPPQR
jgi:hypothetical protein